MKELLLVMWKLVLIQSWSPFVVFLQWKSVYSHQAKQHFKLQAIIFKWNDITSEELDCF